MVKICCDSTADLLNEVHGTNLYSQRGVTVMPLYVQIGDEEYRDGVDITMRELLKRCGEAKTLPKTAAPSVEALQKTFAEMTADGSDVVLSQSALTFHQATAMHALPQKATIRSLLLIP